MNYFISNHIKCSMLSTFFNVNLSHQCCQHFSMFPQTVLAHTKALVAGWGTTSRDTATISSILQIVSYTFINSIQFK
jgi:hypothetical protein